MRQRTMATVLILGLIAAGCTGAPGTTGSASVAGSPVAAPSTATEGTPTTAPSAPSTAPSVAPSTAETAAPSTPESAAPSAPESAPASTEPSSPPVALRDPREAALEAAGGEQLGGSVSLMGVLGGEELEAFDSVLAPFEEATGIQVEYEGSRDLGAVLQTRVDGENPPDVVATPTIGQMFDYAERGVLVDLSQILDPASLEAYDQGLLDIATRNGVVFGLFNTVNLSSLIWHDPKTYTGPTAPATWDELQGWATQTAGSGTTPWCIGLESGAASGWPGAEFITAIMLRQAGPEFHDRWWQGEVDWTSPEIKRAFETYGAIATDPSMVHGGPPAVLATSFQNGADAIYADPPTCFVHHQATFMGGIIGENFPDLEPLQDIDFFGMPDFSPDYQNLQQISGEIVTMFNDTPQSRALVRYLATPEAGVLIAATGRWLSPNRNVPAEAYTDPFLSRAAEILSSAGHVSYLGSDLLPQTLTEGFWKATLDYVNDPTQLDAILANLERLRQEASG